jgi:hypothetical protein
MLTTIIAFAISPSVLATFTKHLQSALNHVDVAAAVRQRLHHRLTIHRIRQLASKNETM